MRTSHVFAAALLAATVMIAGQASAFSLQEQGSGGGAAAGNANAAPEAGVNYLDPDARALQGMLGTGKVEEGGRFDLGGNAGQPGAVFSSKSGFSMYMQQTEKPDTGANRYFSTETNPWR